ncbi:MAG: deoxyribonuclease IV [Bacilli bacterium]|nr:deoxyribonuclease IV [Bacilli bacterium]
MLIIGSHVSFNSNDQLLGSLNQALSYGANTFMFYTGAPQNTNRSKINSSVTEKAIEKMKENNIDLENIIVHAPYIINLANNKEESKYNFSIRFLKEEIKRCEEIGVKYLVLHPGSHVGVGIEEGLQNIIFALNEVNKSNNNIIILLETMAGKGTELGITFEQLKTIIDGVNDKDKIGVCLDTCHLNDAGYDISKFDDLLDQFDKVIGLNYVHCIHINDSKNPIGAHKDRHENIGYGTLGFNNIIDVIYNKRLDDIPKILETPWIGDYAPYKEEIEMIRNKKFNPNLKEGH